MTMLTAEEVVSLYLYGQKTPPTPTDLVSDRFIRSEGVKTSYDIDAVEQGRMGRGTKPTTLHKPSNKYIAHQNPRHPCFTNPKVK